MKEVLQASVCEKGLVVEFWISAYYIGISYKIVVPEQCGVRLGNG